MENSKFKIQNSKAQLKIKNFKFMIFTKVSRVILIFTFCILNFMGCATITETAKSIVGVSTKVLEEGRKSAIVKTVNQDYFTSYTKTLEILKQIGAYIYDKDIKKRMIAIYVSQTDTTAVGLFFKEIDQNNTQIEISSPSTYAKEYFAAKVFPLLEKSASTESQQ